MVSRIILLVFLFNGIMSFSQTDTLNLYLINPKNQTEKKIKQGRRIRVWRSETDVIKGNYTIESDSTIKIGNEIYPLADLNSIKCSTREDIFGSSVAGVLPLVLTIVGINDLAKNTLGIGTQLFIIETGIGVTGMAACTYGILYGRQRKTAKGWKYVIK